MARTTSASSSTMPASADLTIRLAVVRPNAYRVAPASGSVWGLSNAIAEQFSDFQFPYIESTSTCRFEYGGELPLLRMSSNTVKIAGYRLDGTAIRRSPHARTSAVPRDFDRTEDDTLAEDRQVPSYCVQVSASPRTEELLASLRSVSGTHATPRTERIFGISVRRQS